MKKRTYNHLTDAGHGWVSVPFKDLKALNLIDKITHCSHMGLNRAYLEEDCDWTTFYEAATAAGWQVDTRSTQCESDLSWIRKLAPYNSGLASEILRVGKWIKSGDVVYQVIRETKNSFHIQMPFTSVRWSIPKSNPFNYFDSYLPDNYAPQQRAF